MKSIVLCENTLINHQGDSKSLKDGKDKQVEDKAKLNGTTDDKKPELEIADCNSEKSGNIFHNGNNETMDEPSVVEVSENDVVKTAEKSRDKCEPSDEKGLTVTMKTDISCDDKSENCLEGTKNSLDFSENPPKNASAPSNLEEDSDLKDSKPIKCGALDSVDDVCKEVNEVSILDDSGEASEEVAINSTTKDLDHGSLSEDFSKIKDENLNDEIFDVDSNKENEKDEKTNSREDISKESGEEGSSCEIQVEKVQSFSSQESDFIWLPSESEKLQQDLEESSREKETEEAEDVSTCVEESQKSSEEEKETDCHSLEVIEGESSENVENEELQMEVEEADQGVEINGEESKSEQAEWDESSEEADTKKTEEESCGSLTVSKKRPMADKKDEDPSAKKIKLSESQSHEDGSDETKGPESPAGLEEDSSKVGEPFFEEEASGEKISDEGKVERMAKESDKDGESEKESAAPSTSFLDSFRGSLKNLTRSDLEELIVQKLCEVITERSTVGELRRKAQALEQDQERWKVKVQGLTKQMKEMEMVMKKYMSEVQKQLKDGAVQAATPLRVTRSVGLQVSFYAYASKGPKPNAPPPAAPPPTTTAAAVATNPCPAPTINTRSTKGSPKPPPQYTPISQNLRSKSMPTCSKPPPTIQKPPVAPQRRHSVAPSSTPPNRTAPIATIPINNRPIQTQVSGSRPGYKTLSNAPQQMVHQQQPQQVHQQQQQQHGSKVIDLTDDDDQRINNSGKPNTTRVVGHLPQPGAPPNSRYAYILPATSTSTGPGGGQNRQVLIATPAIQSPQQGRQIMCSMPPLLFKGGNQVQSTPQQQVINQNNSRVILPKALRHPAPLPQAPIRNWANMKQLPPRPALKISKVQTGIVLSWNMVLGPDHAPIRSYQLYAYQESNTPPATSLWKKVGDVKALPLPMACTLTQFMSGHKYHFAVRAVDLHSRIGPFSFPGTIVLDKGR